MKILKTIKETKLFWLQNTKKLQHLERISSILLIVGVITFGAGYYLNEFWSLCIPSFIVLALSIVLGDYQ